MPGAPSNYSGTTRYAYDYGQSASPTLNRSQLTGEASTRASGTLAYGYDGGTSGEPGNPTSFKGTANTFNADNQTTGTGFGYDGNGNPTTYKTASLTFDPENRMTADSAGSQTDGYDGDSLRAWKQSGGTKTYFLYDDEQPVCEYGSSGTLLATNTYGADGLVSRHTSAGSTFYLFDERGNVSQRTSSTGSVLGSDLYDAYGTRTGTAAQADPFGYGAQAGYYTDIETGLLLCTHRFYDPSNGRWLTRDPMGYTGGVNLYGYCGNDPGNEDDPDGTAPVMEPPVVSPAPVMEPPTGIGWGWLGPVGMAAGLLFGCPTKIKEEDYECVEALNNLKENLDYFSTRQHYHNKPVLDRNHTIQLEGRCAGMERAINQAQECLNNNAFADPAGAARIIGKARTLFNKICGRVGHSPIPPVRGQ